ncbi:copper resistance CopC family protein [Nonomuraea sp. ZG12]|uniref:copper resistance CopC family protein n=1 Tax=Nonomuraea sp. ZG12 TaxID=3452207 RepID=UPI003F8C58ED
MRRLVTVLLLACAAMAIAPPAQAHNVLISSDPKDGATLSAPPGQITLVFDQPVRQGYAQIGVTGADGSAWADGATTVAAERVTVKVKPLTTGGAYVVGYRILSADGHPVTGKIGFTLTGGGTPTGAPQDAGTEPDTAAQQDAAAPQNAGADRDAGAQPDAGAAAAEAAANGGAGMAVVWIVAALLVLAAGTAVALRRANPRPPADAPDPSDPSDPSDPTDTADAVRIGGVPVRPEEGTRA